MRNSSRRQFIRNAGLGASALSLKSLSDPEQQSSKTLRPQDRLPREVWVATLTTYKLEGSNCQEVIQAALKQMENALPLSPDIICLPEVFHVDGVKGKRPPMEEAAEDGSGHLIGPFQQFAKAHQCYVIPSLYSREGNHFYNSAFLIDRQGNILGDYKKMRPTVGEMAKGVAPGPEDPPVFQTDFGTIGIQTCFDIEWPDGWRKLRQKGAEMVFWTSAFGGGKMVNTMAWLYKYPVISSTRKGTTKICDVTGEEIAASGSYDRWGVCAPINLEKVFLHTWPYNRQFAAIQKKYGQKVRIYTLHEEEFSIIESRSPEVKIAEIMKDFDLKTHSEHMLIAENQHKKFWS